MNPDKTETLRKLLRSARSVCVLTGAGISAESGIPTFRGPGGLWRDFRPEELATPQAFAKDPKTVWEWYDWRRQLIAKAEPNAGHLAVAKFTIVTQNVDGLHQRAGSRNVIEVHGSIWKVRCVQCNAETMDERPSLPELPPRCECGGLLRPGVVWFGEGLSMRVWDNAEKAVCASEILLVVGTSAVVHPAASLAPMAKLSGATVVEINPDETALSDEVDYSIRGTAAQVLPLLLE
ncbi:MAG TPA: NAD-dependent deacylase [Bryobacteraceae bacterium]|nr:NAD-dependent deacylase [Bryobacteraceae bacterium]